MKRMKLWETLITVTIVSAAVIVAVAATRLPELPAGRYAVSQAIVEGSELQITTTDQHWISVSVRNITVRVAPDLNGTYVELAETARGRLYFQANFLVVLVRNEMLEEQWNVALSEVRKSFWEPHDVVPDVR